MPFSILRTETKRIKHAGRVGILTRLVVYEVVVVRILIRHLQGYRELVLHVHHLHLPRLLRQPSQRVLGVAQVPQLVHRRRLEDGADLVPLGRFEEGGYRRYALEGCVEVGD